MKRREFLHQFGLATAAAGLAPAARAASNAAPASGRTMTAAIIGHTGRGQYGHSLEMIFAHRPEIQVVAVADPSDAARQKVEKAVGALRGYKDYREMLERERPDLVSVAPRWTDQRHAMVSAALAAGAHVYCEKPFTRTLAEADDLVAQAKRLGRKLAISHPIRFAPGVVYLKKRIAEGILGELQSIRANGKQDSRAGGEDLFVHGTHLFDLVRLIAGESTEVTARILHQGREITRADARDGVYDNVGPVAGDDVEAWFKLARGITVHYTSRQKPSAPAGPFTLEFVGSRASARMACGYDPVITLGQGDKWGPVPGDPGANLSPKERQRFAANARVVDDWLAAIAGNREPTSSGYDGMKAIEMIHGVYAAALSRGPVKIPLRNREHALTS